MCQLPPVNVGRLDGGVTPGGELLGLAALLDLCSPGKKGNERVEIRPRSDRAPSSVVRRVRSRVSLFT